MNKPQSLYEALVHGVPYLREHPEKMRPSVRNGALVATGGHSASWEYRYTLNVTIDGYDDEPHRLMIPVMLWLNDNQPDAINNPALREKVFTFSITPCADGSNNNVRLSLRLTERVLLDNPGGSQVVNLLPEPDRPEEMWTVKRK
ncbi:phage tail protein [Erwinia sp. SLM-02]|uniref:phage tail protein n=1 Tax=Erwinia sp. SLM-02 TaxID=3020057 RepID=UPI003080A8C6